MTDIKLKPDCELAKAILQFGNAYFDCGAWEEGDEPRYKLVSDAADKARAHLLEVIREGNERSAKHGDEEDCREPGAYRAIANEIMGAESDD